ncbi:general secretion pathway protein F [Ereboglobus sp. PH5-10]|uniref:type II secretion system F family protein n=1 Tax=Ereboglobus sp. PH5-10 TaxID=2940629 RepID=UPI0024068D1F|nr:type II secretion system F family protein [Ereboglobus sp. PH5-10]MDF9826244.1 general secretion pathway protein F [Ereboglobus sp. PH5-10]
MPAYTYTARDRSGQTVTSTLEAPSRKDALRHLTARGLQPQRIEEVTAGGAVIAKPAKSKAARSGAAASSPKQSASSRGSKSKKPKPLSKKEQLPFLEALSDLVSSGLSAGESLRMLSQRIREPKLRFLCASLWERIGEGATLSRAMAEFPQVFDTSAINLIQAGEATGGLSEVLTRLIAHYNEQNELRRQFVSALAYPILLLTVAFGVILFFMFFLMPRMQGLFNSLGGKLPASTRLMVGMSDFALHYGIFIAGALVFGAIAFWRWRKTARGRHITDGWLLKLPLTKNFTMSQSVLAFSQTLSILLENGITTTDALKITERQIGNTVHREAFGDASAHVMEGGALSSALQRTECFPPLVLDQLAIGENTGSIVPSLKKISNSYRKIVSAQLNFFMKVITSVMLGGTFVFVGFIAFAIVSAIFTLSGSFRM